MNDPVKLGKVIRDAADQALLIAANALTKEIQEEPALRDYLAAQIAMLIVKGGKNPIRLADQAIQKFWKRRQRISRGF